MRRCATGPLTLAVVALLAGAAPAAAQHSASLGHFSLFYDLDRRTDTGGYASDFSLLTAYITLKSPPSDADGFEYAVDARTTTYPSSSGGSQSSIYDAYVGDTLWGGKLGIRLGQMWLNDLGALGSVGGFDVELRQPSEDGTRWREGLFAGAEPTTFQAGYATGIRKAGAYVAYDGHAAQRHVLGLVMLRNQGVKERSVLTTTNFLPVGQQLYLYVIGEYDLHGPGGEGSGGLSYLFANARILPVSAFEIQLNYNHGRSVDARSITNDEIAGRPVDPRMLEGFLFDSAGARLTVNITRSVRVYAGYAEDRNNQDDRSFGRTIGGASFSNVARSGIDINFYASRIERSMGPYTSYYASIGRSLSSRIYLTADYTSSLSVLQLASSGGVLIESRPRARRYSLQGTANLGGRFSLFLTVERVDEDTSRENRVASGLTVRF
jgi:hypothetical protein